MQVSSDFESAIMRKYPEGVAVAIVKDAQGKFNPITLCWIMRTSFEPPMLAVALAVTRYSLPAIRQAREFVVSLPTAEMSQHALFFGSVSGRDVDKLAQSGVRTEPAGSIDCVLLADAVANFECKLEGELATGDHVILVGRVVASHRNQNPEVRGLYALGEYRFGGVSPA